MLDILCAGAADDARFRRRDLVPAGTSRPATRSCARAAPPTPTGTPVVITGGPGCPHGTSVFGGGARVATPLPKTPLGQSIDGGAMNRVSTIVSTSTQPVTGTFSTICAA